MQIIALISGKGGVGKSTLTANIAMALTQREKRVLVIDLDPQNTQRHHLGMDPDEIAGLVREGISSHAIFDSPFGMQFIPFGRVQEGELDEFAAGLKKHPTWLADGIESIGDKFDFVLLDTPPGPTVYLQQAIRAAHRALVIVLSDAASYATLPKITALVEQYTEGRKDFLGMHRLINQMPTRGRLGHQVRDAIFSNVDAQVVPVVIHKDERVSQALAFERPVLEYYPGCKASLDIQYVTDWIIESEEQ
jgi:cellulose synthase operon protein YhjQ